MPVEQPLIELIQNGYRADNCPAEPRIEAVIVGTGGMNPVERTLAALGRQTLPPARVTLILPPGLSHQLPQPGTRLPLRLISHHSGSLSQLLNTLLPGNDSEYLAIFLAGDTPTPWALEVLSWTATRQQADFVLCGPKTEVTPDGLRMPFELPENAPDVSRVGLFAASACREAGGFEGGDLLDDIQRDLVRRIGAQKGRWIRLALCTQSGSKPRPRDPGDEPTQSRMPVSLPHGGELERHTVDFPFLRLRNSEQPHVLWVLPHLSADEAHGLLPAAIEALNAEGVRSLVATFCQSDHRFTPRLRDPAAGAFHTAHFAERKDRLSVIAYLAQSRAVKSMVILQTGWGKMATPVLRLLFPEIPVVAVDTPAAFAPATRQALKSGDALPLDRPAGWKLDVDRYNQWLRERTLADRWAAHARQCIPQQNELLLWRSLWPPSRLYPWLAKRFAKRPPEEVARKLLKRS